MLQIASASYKNLLGFTTDCKAEVPKTPMNGTHTVNNERKRLKEARDSNVPWRRWGPYLSERQWGTVREDYSSDGDAWASVTHDQARSRAYRWGEDGLLGISDDHQRLCLAIALWNGNDHILKERPFGLTGPEGNHGEDVKEYYYYLDNIPTHSYMRALYKYPQARFPYEDLLEQSKKRTRFDPEYELVDTGIFVDNSYFDVFATYAKAATDDILLEIEVVNRGKNAATLHVLPTLWFRNEWSWKTGSHKPIIRDISGDEPFTILETTHATLGDSYLYAESGESLFTENETNTDAVFGIPNETPYVKDAFHRRVIDGDTDAVNPKKMGTKASVWYQVTLDPGQSRRIRLRLVDEPELDDPLGDSFTEIMTARRDDADHFYQQVNPFPLSEDARSIQRQALAGMLWSKQFYNYVVHDWLKGDPNEPPPPASRRKGRNHEWQHLYSNDILSMPDTWEYPWFAAWDHAFHMIPLAMIDPDFAKSQLMLLTREWYMHPNGQIPAYEWAFGDVNPPVQAWAALRVYRIDKKMHGQADRSFLERVFQKLLLNFTWWVNRKDASGNNIFQGGFLGLDNIGVFNRSESLPDGTYINQSDGTSWMAFYSLGMLAIALELAKENHSYEDIASKFYEHFLYIADAMNQSGNRMIGLWDEEDEFYYDALSLADGEQITLKVRSMVGLIPLLAVETLNAETLEQFPGFKHRMEWFIRNRHDLRDNVASMEETGEADRRLLAIVDKDRLRAILKRMLDESEFLSPFGIRALSRSHKDHPYSLDFNGTEHRVDYEPAESTSGLFGGNSNWRGPVWFPLGYLLIEALQKFHRYFGDDFLVECPTGSGNQMTLWDVATEISRRMIKLFTQDKIGNRPIYGETDLFQKDPHWSELVLFYEYFHGETGEGLGASHQTGWTGLVAKLIQQVAEYDRDEKTPL